MDQLKVRLSDERQLEAENVDADLRCGRIRIKDEVPCDLPTAQLNNLDALKVDDWALAIGAPFNLTQTVTAGIIGTTVRKDES